MFPLAAACSAAVLLSACGGGGGDTAPPPSNPPVQTQVQVQGNVSGLTASGLQVKLGQETVSIAANGTSFAFPTTVATGTSYRIAIAAQPTGQTCRVTPVSGTAGSGNPVVECRPYVVYNQLPDSVQVLQLKADGSMDPVALDREALPFARTSTHPLVSSPDDHHAYLVDTELGTVHVFDVAADGALTRRANDMVRVPDAGAHSIAVTPDGRFAYVSAEQANTVLVYQRTDDGRLVPHSSFRVSPGEGPTQLYMHPGGKHLYVRCANGRLAHFSIREDGALIAGAPANAWWFAIHPTGGFALAADGVSPPPIRFGFAADGSLASPTTQAALPYFFDGAFTADGKYFLSMHVNPAEVHRFNGTLAAWAVGSDGTLTQLPQTATLSNKIDDYRIQSAPAGNRVYVLDNWTDDRRSIGRYEITSEGLELSTPDWPVLMGTNLTIR